MSVRVGDFKLAPDYADARVASGINAHRKESSIHPIPLQHTLVVDLALSGDSQGSGGQYVPSILLLDLVKEGGTKQFLDGQLCAL